MSSINSYRKQYAPVLQKSASEKQGGLIVPIHLPAKHSPTRQQWRFFYAQASSSHLLSQSTTFVGDAADLYPILKVLSPIDQRCSCWLNAIAAIHGITRPQTAPIINKRETVADLAGPKPREALVIETARRHLYFSSELHSLHEKPIRTPWRLTKKPTCQQWRRLYCSCTTSAPSKQT